MNMWLAGASVLTAFIAVLHIFAGGARAAAPLLRSADLDFEAKYTKYYCWHLVSITLAVMTGALAYAAFDPSGFELGILAAGLAAAFAAASLILVVALRDRRALTDLPQWGLFLPVAIIAAIGLS